MVAKVFIYVLAVFMVQSGVVFDECRKDIVDSSMVMAWLTFEVLAFYLNIISMGVFLLLSSCKKFKSIKDRIGLSGDQRKTQDFLNYCKDDIHWFCMWYGQFCLVIFSLVMRQQHK